jgi:hypothetical protein
MSSVAEQRYERRYGRRSSRNFPLEFREQLMMLGLFGHTTAGLCAGTLILGNFWVQIPWWTALLIGAVVSAMFFVVTGMGKVEFPVIASLGLQGYIFHESHVGSLMLGFALAVFFSIVVTLAGATGRTDSLSTVGRVMYRILIPLVIVELLVLVPFIMFVIGFLLTFDLGGFG